MQPSEKMKRIFAIKNIENAQKDPEHSAFNIY